MATCFRLTNIFLPKIPPSFAVSPLKLHQLSNTYSEALFLSSERLRSSVRRNPNRDHQASPFSTCCSLRVVDFLNHEPSSSNAAILRNSHEVVRNMKLEVTDTSEATLRFIQHLSLADLDPATAKVAIGVIGPVLSAFSFLFILRVIMSWYPKLPVGKFPYVIAYAPTEPFLVPTRKLIPPLAGVDITPVVWIGLTNFLNEILVGPQGLLVLLSQQVN
ncbi:hypothetical protein LWI29_035332 [Acer saccharum]|uniref:Protein COFACTOR ASSEMBLY OF COMPLEX C SUBUNIT B CCB3, chloroplastic n=1 Tax=Acer saccharum TaxID=4024 RepID=A0AA39RJ66_ACESA|nr:hypothetical protein LWI29_035332 [Acer saccharum]